MSDGIIGIQKKSFLEIETMPCTNIHNCFPAARLPWRQNCQITLYKTLFIHTAPLLQVVRASSHTSEGIPEVWAKMESYRDAMLASGELQGRRRAQQKVWMWSLIQETVLLHFQNHPSVRDTLPRLQERVTKGSISPGLAADLLLKAFSSSSSSS